MTKNKGLTLIELLIVIGILAILTAGIVIAVNPAKQFAQARNAQRWSHVEAILNAVNQNMVDNRGTFTCGAGVVPVAPGQNMASGVGNYDICPCVAGSGNNNYLASIPFDPVSGTAQSANPCVAGTTYNSGYTIARDATTGRVTVSAPGAEGETISVRR